MQAMALVATTTMTMMEWEAARTTAVSRYLVYSNSDDTMHKISLGVSPASLGVFWEAHIKCLYRASACWCFQMKQRTSIRCCLMCRG